MPFFIFFALILPEYHSSSEYVWKSHSRLFFFHWRFSVMTTRVWHYRRKMNMKRNRTNRSLFSSCIFFLLHKKPHAIHTFAYFFFLSLFFLCRHVAHWCWFVYYTNITTSDFVTIIIIKKTMESEKVLT